jgi:hypothetical protein
MQAVSPIADGYSQIALGNPPFLAVRLEKALPFLRPLKEKIRQKDEPRRPQRPQRRNSGKSPGCCFLEVFGSLRFILLRGLS